MDSYLSKDALNAVGLKATWAREALLRVARKDTSRLLSFAKDPLGQELVGRLPANDY